MRARVVRQGGKVGETDALRPVDAAHLSGAVILTCPLPLGTAGYGAAEADLESKHPEKFNHFAAFPKRKGRHAE